MSSRNVFVEEILYRQKNDKTWQRDIKEMKTWKQYYEHHELENFKEKRRRKKCITRNNPHKKLKFKL